MTKNSIYFVSGIDTGCGKTFATGMLAKHLFKAGVKVITQKLVQTGSDGIAEDIIEHRRLMECEMFDEDKNGLTCPYIFKFPSSPHLAAKLENQTIDVNYIDEATLTLSILYNIVMIEGAGGLMVPLRNNLLTIDYIKSRNYPLVLVASSKLGSINHTLLSIESCYNRGIHLHTLIYNHLPDSNETISADTFEVITKYVTIKYPKANILTINDKLLPNKVLELFAIKINN